MYDIKTCPFCGGNPYLETSHRAFINGESTKVAFVRCVCCNARSGRKKLSDYGRSSYSEAANRAAVDEWNSRVGWVQNINWEGKSRKEEEDAS